MNNESVKVFLRDNHLHNSHTLFCFLLEIKEKEISLEEDVKVHMDALERIVANLALGLAKADKEQIEKVRQLLDMLEGVLDDWLKVIVPIVNKQTTEHLHG